MTRERLRSLGFTLVILVAAACGRPDESCNTSDEGLSVRFVGQAYGYGSLLVSWNDETQHHRVVAHMMGNSSGTEIRLEGEGECKAGVLRARLGGGADANSKMRVLGGGLVVLFEHEPMPSVTGLWEVTVVNEAKENGGAEQRLRGMLEVADAPEILGGDEGGAAAASTVMPSQLQTDRGER